MNVLISIKPEHANNILRKKKKFEFRKKISAEVCGKKVYIYSSSPTKKIVGYFVPSEIITGSPREVWEHCKNSAGITEKDFFAYFDNRDTGFALKISCLTCFAIPVDPRDIFPSFVPPQSYYYLDKNLERCLCAY